jgi:DNA uptake protein ComE-like DNA-binding protein
MERATPLAGAGALLAVLGLVALAAAGHPHARARRASAGDAGVPDDSAPPRPGRDATGPSEGARALLEGRPMDLNRASQEDLRLLPRIGPTLAERIDDDRRERGEYGQLDDLARVSGVGEATVEGLRALACAGRDCPGASTAD